ncbi:THAP domain-containing protein 7-like isoform X2 [Hypanus sabinus]|nr:THAP domain-containing protein 7-like isoform X2 [Hypanus sabinus]XP_059809638.1 THAP domain-containing protein 7-like isoform X2 [Hypanus sabinus]XP_059809639.1 THAP domain-containing protein 7-like isoform X2 [Hypanus sabinus]XP_059809640.1 THAP domain-containing protein 7-like isoform X2 [Hypanus sabinus]
MPRHCSAEGCRSRDTKDSRINGITFHRLPKKGKSQREIWLLNCCRKNPDGTVPWKPSSQFVYFCSKHFERQCFELVGLSGYHRLRDDAVPTLFQPSPRGKVALPRASREKAAEPVATSECLTNEVALPDVDLGNPSPSLETSFCISPDAPAYVLDYSVPQETVNGNICPDKVLLTEVPLYSSQSELETSAPTVIYLVDTEAKPVEFSNSASSEEASKDVSLTEVSDSCQEEPHNVRTPIPIDLYMARIPSASLNPAAHVSAEHSYAVGCPLVWKKRAEALKEAFEKVNKDLRASRKRESRLRARISSILRARGQRLRDKQLKLDLTGDLPSQVEMFEVQVMDETVGLCSPLTS